MQSCSTDVRGSTFASPSSDYLLIQQAQSGNLLHKNNVGSRQELLLSSLPSGRCRTAAFLCSEYKGEDEIAGECHVTRRCLHSRESEIGSWRVGRWGTEVETERIQLSRDWSLPPHSSISLSS